MTTEQAGEMLLQHANILLNIERLWTALVVMAFLGLVFIFLMFFAAIWSVRKVNKRQELTEGKWNTLVDLLIHTAREAQLERGHK